MRLLYLGNWYERRPTGNKNYYFFGGQRIAMRNAYGVVRYVHGDQLASTTDTTRSGGSTGPQYYSIIPTGTRAARAR